MSNHKLELFIRRTCPFCVKVLNYLDRRGIEIPLRDISIDPEAEATLISVGGKRQVPCLFIDGSPLYESGDIIAWLDENA
ncbi:MAG: glutaredoxin [Coriobacteriaceae bacterium]|nr:glutaredoxin [Coriobacteriaceae bacterium]